eukprot:scaffold11521_cov68-Phaeocystis_antarctica.AAC.6
MHGKRETRRCTHRPAVTLRRRCRGGRRGRGVLCGEVEVVVELHLLHLPSPLAKVGRRGARGIARLRVADAGPYQLQQHGVQCLYGAHLRAPRAERHREQVDDLEDLHVRVRQLYAV